MLDFPKVFPLLFFRFMILIDFEVVGFYYCEISLNSFTPSEDVRPCFPCYFLRCHICIVILPSVSFWCSFQVLFIFPIAQISCLVWLPEVANSWSPGLGQEGEDGMQVVFLYEAVALLQGFLLESGFVPCSNFLETVIPYQVFAASCQVPDCRASGLFRASQFFFSFPYHIVLSFP